MRIVHSLDMTVYGATRDDVEREAIGRATDYFGHGGYDIDIAAEPVQTMSGQLIHWEAKVTATLTT